MIVMTMFQKLTKFNKFKRFYSLNKTERSLQSLTGQLNKHYQLSW